MVDHGDQVLGLHLLAEHGKAPQIAHHDRKGALLSAQLPSVRSVEDLFGDIVGKITAESLLQHAVAKGKTFVQLPDFLHGFDRIPHLRQLRDVTDDQDHADSLVLLLQIRGHDTQLFEGAVGKIGNISLLPSSLPVDHIQDAVCKGLILLFCEKTAGKRPAFQLFSPAAQNIQTRIIDQNDLSIEADRHNTLGHVRDYAVLNKHPVLHCIYIVL